MDTQKQTQSYDDHFQSDRATLPFERRRSSRYETAGHVTLLRQTPADNRMQFPVCSIHMFDMSQHGIGARCDLPLHVDEPVSVFLPPHGSDGGVDLIGHVTRVTPAEPSGYRIGIAFDPRPAA